MNGGKPVLWLLLFYLCSVAARFLIGLLASQNPFVMPDEALYANIARSIAGGFGVTLRNQELTYTSLAYPLMISPIYLLFGAGQQFRAIQALNCLVMNLAVFPAYGIAKSVTGNRRTALGIAAVSLLLPDMLLTTRVMAEPLTYPLFLLAVYMMNGKFTGKRARPGDAALTGLVMFALFGAKSGAAALAAVFLGILIWDIIRRRGRADILYAVVVAGVFAGLLAAARLALQWSGMDFSWKSIYQTQAQAPGIEHLKKTLQGLLLYAFFIPAAFGIYPLLLPAANLKAYDGAGRRLAALAIAALALYAAGACYMFFDTETVGSYFAGRIHIRYVFMFLPVFLALAFSPKLEGVRPNGLLLGSLGFLLAMTATVSFSALLSNRQYPVDAIMLSYIIHDDGSLNWEYLSQIAFIVFAISILILLYRRGWLQRTRRVCAICLTLGLLTAGALGYDLNSYNNSKALADDARQGAETLSEGSALLVPDGDIWFDNTLSVLDTAMTRAPYAATLEDVCAALGPYGRLQAYTPRQYWTEKPTKEIPAAPRVAFAASAFNRMVLAAGASVQYTKNGYYGIVSLGADGRLLHSALAGISASGKPGADAALYVFDEQTLTRGAVRVYLKVHCENASSLTLTSGGQKFDYNLDASSDWIYADLNVPEGTTVLKVSITATGGPKILTYSLK